MARRTVNAVGHIRPFFLILLAALLGLFLIILTTQSARTHGSPIIDGAFTGDWCARAGAGFPGPDTLVTLTPPGCALGTEFFYDDWDAINYGGGLADTMGWLLGGVPGTPVSDPETDIDFFVTTADNNVVFFAVALGPFPSVGGPPPHVQIAIDVDGPVTGNPMWYDPLAVGVIPAGLAVPLFADYLITTDVLAGTGFLWEATTAPGLWTLVAPVPLGWSGATGLPGVIEVAVPWALFGPGPAFGTAVPAHLTLMSAHSGAFAGPSDAPVFAQDDVITESGMGFTTSPDVCPPGPPTTDCELFVGPGGGGGSADAFIPITYPAIPYKVYLPIVLND